MRHDAEQKNQRALKALQDMLEGLTGDETQILHVFKTYLEENEERYYSFARKMQKAWARTAVGLVLALAVGGYITHQIQDAATRAEKASVEVEQLGRENRQLINRLKIVATQAQLNGARADKIQCREIERLKAPIREVLTRTGADRFLPLFKQKACNALPNATPVQP